MPVLFTNLALLGGLAAVALPILIHLLLKRKKQRLRFSTIQFFVKQDEQASKRRKLRNWLLLALRILLVALLVLAFARPFTQTASLATGETKRIGLFVLDRSVSMQAMGGGETAWKQGLNLVRKTLGELKANDEAALVTCSARTEVFTGLKPAAAIARLLDGLMPEFTGSDLAEGLRKALKLASTRETGCAATIYLVSDLQKNSLQDFQSVTVPADIEVKLLKPQELYTANVGIVDLSFEGQVKPEARISLKSFSDEDHSELKLSLLVDDQELATTVVALPAGLTTNVVLGLPALKPGWHSAEARLLTNDPLKADNARYHALFIPEPLRVLCVETKGQVPIHEQDTLFVASALQPEAEPGTHVPALFAVEITEPSALVGKLALGKGKGSAGYAAVVLPALRHIPDNAGAALSTYVQNGGGLLLFLGEGMSANRYNAEFRDLLPVKLDSVDSRANDGWRLDTFDKNSPLFSAFQGATAINLRLPEFTRRFRVSSTVSRGVSSTLAAFDDGLPLILARTIGAGRVVLVNTSADTSWSDWPKWKSFVPWLHGTVHYLGGRSSTESMQPSRLFTAGEDAEIMVGQPWKRSSLVIQHVGEKGAPLTTDEEGRLPSIHFGTPGTYVVRDSQGVELQRWAVNPPSGESDLTALSSRDFQKQLLRDRQPQPVTLQASLFGAAKGEKEWWRVLLLASLCLLFGELFLANRTRA